MCWRSFFLKSNEMSTLLFNCSVQTWISALTGASIVGLVGTLPLFIIPNEQNQSKINSHFQIKLEIIFVLFYWIEDKPYLEILLSVAVGSQLADVFLHLLPEAFAHPHASSTYIGLWTLIGLFLFFIIEQIFPEDHHESQQKIKVFFSEV